MSAIILTAKRAKTAKLFLVCSSLFVPFVSFAVQVFLNRSVHNDSNRERRKTCESLYWFASPRSRRSRCSRFMLLKGSVPRKPLLHSQKVLPKGICPKSRATGAFPLSPILPPVVAQNPRKFVWFASPRSRRSRFKFLNRRAHCNFHRERFYCLFICVRVVRVVRGSRF